MHRAFQAHRTARSRSDELPARLCARRSQPAGCESFGRGAGPTGEQSTMPTITASATETSLSERWAEALRSFDADLRTRAAAEKTRRAYGSDLARFAQWCVGH